MQSIKKIYKIGYGPSSSHTMGPRFAAEMFLERVPNATSYEVTLYGSLAATGKGHLTPDAINDAFRGRVLTILWKPEIVLPFHPNGMLWQAFDQQHKLVYEMTAYSVGGGEIHIDGEEPDQIDLPYLNTMAETLQHVEAQGSTLWQYVEELEGQEIYPYLEEVWRVMQASITSGIDKEGALPGALKLNRKASTYALKAVNHHEFLHHLGLLFSYALAVAEENASGGIIVTAPTCGSCGVLPATLKLIQNTYQVPDVRIIRALMTAGLVGNLVKQNASISGAEVGCQGEIGTACAMAAAAAAQLLGATPAQIEYAAEMGMEHHLGLTCDPVMGLVQIPCIERNAFAAERAFGAAMYALLSDGRHRVSFDQVIRTMAQTGHDMNASYRETSEGGLARFSK